MHDAQYTKKIKALLAAREELTLNLNSCVYQFRNGRKPYVENLEQFKKAVGEALAILEFLEEAAPGKDARREQAIRQAQEEDRKPVGHSEDCSCYFCDS